MTRTWCATVALGAALSLAACGGSDASRALDDTTSKLGELRSGELALTVAVEPDTEGSGIGFELKGPFELAGEAGQLPRADLVYTQIAGPNEGDVRFISSESQAWVEVDGQAYELPTEQTEQLRAGEDDGGGPLAELDVGSWTRDAKLAAGPVEDGEPTERVTGRVEVADAINDLLGVLEDSGAGEGVEGLDQLDGEDADGVDEAVRSSSLKLLTGKEDRLLRSLELAIDFAVKARQLPGGLGELSGAKVTLDLRIARPNEPVEIEEPEGALPYEELPQG